MERECNNCGKTFEHGVSGNMIIFCPYCKKSAGSISDYGFGPITPCDIYCGKTIVGHISRDYFLTSTQFKIQKQLAGEYANLAVYQEAEDIIQPYLKKSKI